MVVKITEEMMQALIRVRNIVEVESLRDSDYLTLRRLLDTYVRPNVLMVRVYGIEKRLPWKAAEGLLALSTNCIEQYYQKAKYTKRYYENYRSNIKAAHFAEESNTPLKVRFSHVHVPDALRVTDFACLSEMAGQVEMAIYVLDAYCSLLDLILYWRQHEHSENM